MTNPSDLLRLLEPAVRPVDGGDYGKPDSPGTFEGKSFDQLLSQARQHHEPNSGQSEGASRVSDDSSDSPARPTAALPGLGSIENASLARLLASRPASNPELPQ